MAFKAIRVIEMKMVVAGRSLQMGKRRFRSGNSYIDSDRNSCSDSRVVIMVVTWECHENYSDWRSKSQ
jgi:hypothetical protein